MAEDKSPDNYSITTESSTESTDSTDSDMEVEDLDTNTDTGAKATESLPCASSSATALHSPSSGWDRDKEARYRLQLRYAAQNTDEWKDARERHFDLTASQFPDVLGVGYGSRIKLWRVLTKRQDDTFKSPQTLRYFAQGHDDEQALVDQLSDWLQTARRPHRIFTTGVWSHPTYWRIGASPDRRIWFEDIKDWQLVECKSRQDSNAARLPTLNHYVQMQVQMEVTDHDLCWYVCANVRDNPSRVICLVTRDRDLWSELLWPRAKEFLYWVQHDRSPPQRQTDKPIDMLVTSYRNHVIRRDPPPVTNRLYPPDLKSASA